MREDNQRIQDQLRLKLFPGARLLLGVSGGLDSCVLLHACKMVQAELGLVLEIAHIDHGLRPESAQDALFVRDLAAKNGLEFHLHTAQPTTSSQGIEAWGRSERYRFFSRVIEERGLEFVVTAHHANDRAETVLMRFLANREPSSIHALDFNRKILRPLLDLKRCELETVAREQLLDYREDASNADAEFLRNRYRNQIIPYLEQQLSTDLIGVLADRAEALEDDASGLEELSRRQLESLSRFSVGSKEWLRALKSELERAPVSLAWRMVERILAAVYGDYFGRRTSLRVLGFIQGQELAIEIPGVHRIRRTAGGLEFL